MEKRLAHRYKVAIFAIFVLLFLSSPFIESAWNEYLEREKEFAVAVAELPKLRLQLNSLFQWFEGRKELSRDEYMSTMVLALKLRTKFELCIAQREVEIADYIVSQTSKRLLVWAEKNNPEFQERVEHYKFVSKREDISAQMLFLQLPGFAETQQEINRIAFGKRVETEKIFGFGKWAGLMYLYFIPFGFLMLLINLCFHKRSLKAQLICGWWRVAIASLFSPFVVSTFGGRDYLEDRKDKIRRELYPGRWYRDISPDEEAKVCALAMEPIAKVDRTIKRGTFAFVCMMLLTFLSMPFGSVGKAKAGEKKAKRDTVLVDSSKSANLPKSDPPPIIHGQIMFGCTKIEKEPGRTELKSAIITVLGSHAGWNYEAEADLPKNAFVRRAIITRDFGKMVKVKAGKLMTSWLYSLPAPHFSATIGGTKLSSELPLFESGAEVGAQKGGMSGSLSYLGTESVLSRIRYERGQFNLNMLSFFKTGGKRWVAATANFASRLFETHAVFINRTFGASKNSVSIEAGVKPVSQVYCFWMRELIFGKLRNVLGVRVSLHKDFQMKLNFPGGRNVLGEFSFLF